MTELPIIPNEQPSLVQQQPPLRRSLTRSPSINKQRMIGKYFLCKTLGRGSMGKVKLAINSETGEKLAVKIVSRKIQSSIEKNPKVSEKSREIRTVREASIMLLLNHPHIAQVHDMVLVNDYYYMFMEYVDGGQLLDYIISHGKLKEKQARHISRQIASALDYCHRNSIVHRDLKVENILISRNGNIKIIDFGLSNVFTARSHLSTFCGSLYFAAPELLDGKLYTGPEVDVWSFGIVIYVLVCGKVPFDDPTMTGMHRKVKQGLVDYPSYLSTECKHLLQRMIVTDATRRASMSEVIVHPWINKGYDKLVENYLVKRKPLRLPVDNKVIEGMKGFEFGSKETIKAELEYLIESEEYQRDAKLLEALSASPNDISRSNSKTRKAFHRTQDDPMNMPAAYHPLVSIYYLVQERMQSDTLFGKKTTAFIQPHRMSKSQEQETISPHTPLKKTNRFAEPHHTNTSNLLRRLSQRKSRPIPLPQQTMVSEDMTKVLVDDAAIDHNGVLSKKFNRFLKRATSITVKDFPSLQQQKLNQTIHGKDKHRRKSTATGTPSQLEYPTDCSALPHADESIRSVFIRGLFSVSTTSTKKASVIRTELIRVLNRKRHVYYREQQDRFECWSDQGIVFDIYIVKIPWLLGIRGVQFRRISGDPWQYKSICSQILDLLQL